MKERERVKKGLRDRKEETEEERDRGKYRKKRKIEILPGFDDNVQSINLSILLVELI